ncbi:hypothetical protein SLEP1_g52083 [Rubroshorea leprosula]|uniref:DNA-directed RNA polymerase subunit n=1 Tax=Rubroshorea leprosula TaxID=152421 RepID=A0AAV5M8J7_9ROSI|nr:hypothetical protein SLEP1_g52083 [Rubroshorea leprosula]
MVAITGIENIGKGLICNGTGFVTFPVKYRCVLFRPFKGEILEAVVTMVNKVTVFYLLVSSLNDKIILRTMDFYCFTGNCICDSYRWDSLQKLDLFKFLFQTM